MLCLAVTGTAAQEVVYSLNEAGIRHPTVFPVPDGRGGHTEPRRDPFLVKSEFDAALAQVVAEGDGFLGKFWKWRNSQGNFDFVS